MENLTSMDTRHKYLGLDINVLIQILKNITKYCSYKNIKFSVTMFLIVTL